MIEFFSESPLGIVLLCLLAGAAVLLFRSLRGGTRTPSVSPKPSRAPNPVRRNETLAKQFCDMAEEIERLKAAEAYNRVFFRYARLYQQLLGLERRAALEKMPPELLLEEVAVSLANSGAERVLTPQGFPVRTEQEPIDRDACFQGCLALPDEELEREAAQQQRLLRHYQNVSNYRGWLEAAGPTLYRLAQAVRTEDADSCRRELSAFRAALVRQGCCPVYHGDPEAAALQADFLDDAPDATELPGLYSRRPDGSYLLAGRCVGTRRVSS